MRKRIEKILDGKVVVGHSIHYDLECLDLTPKSSIVDISLLKPIIALYEKKMSVSVGNAKIG